ncbi:MAG: hydrogenase maturation protease [Bacillota bacterium]
MSNSTVLIAVGNRLMTDDAVALAAAERLQPTLEEMGLKVVIAETDLSCAIHQIGPPHRIIVLDAAISGREVGSVWRVPRGEWCAQRSLGLSQHGFGLVEWMRLAEPRVVDVIGIEVADLGWGFGLSIALQAELERIIADVVRNVVCIMKQ